MREVSRILWEADGIKIGRNTLFKLLRDAAVVNRKNQPHPRYISAGCFTVIRTRKGSGFELPMTLVLPEGIHLIRKVVAAAMEKKNSFKLGKNGNDLSFVTERRVMLKGYAMMKTTQKVEIFTDGACSGNPGPGWWAAIIRQEGGKNHEISGGEKITTNNRMELIAAIEALKCLKEPRNVTVNTDSQYLQKGITDWIVNWKRNGWKTADKKPVKNADLWRELLSLDHVRQINWQWLKGHTGHSENERCDELAHEAIVSALTKPYFSR